jgi:diaminohydroxyphosphoribosylaminopyrimidine deaminase/5-amino-6-(5-phosphoribosylamino)uracil reductase
LIDAGIRRVVTAVVDPDERVNQLGHAMLREAGIEVVTDVCADESGADLAGYLKHKKLRQPFVTLKLAVSADGLIGVRGRAQATVTGAAARARSHMMRARNHAILVGSGTVTADNPELTCRLPGLENHSPIRIVLDTGGHLTGDEKVTDTHNARTLIAAPPDHPAMSQLVRRGCTMLACDVEEGRVALPELLDDLGSLGILSLLVEGGAAVASSFLAEQLVDEIALFTAPVELGSAGEPVRSPILQGSIPDGFAAIEEARLGDDRLVRCRKVS